MRPTVMRIRTTLIILSNVFMFSTLRKKIFWSIAFRKMSIFLMRFEWHIRYFWTRRLKTFRLRRLLLRTQISFWRKVRMRKWILMLRLTSRTRQKYFLILKIRTFLLKFTEFSSQGDFWTTRLFLSLKSNLLVKLKCFVEPNTLLN